MSYSSRRVVVGLICVIASALPSPAAVAQSVTWRVETPFRLIVDPAAADEHRAVLDALSADERRTPVLAVERRLGSAKPRGWAEAWIDQLCWSPERQHYGCAGAEPYAHPASHRVRLGLDKPRRGTCRWTIDARERLPSASARSVAHPCAESLVVDVPYPHGAAVSVVTEDGNQARADVRVRDLLIVSIGDSFASGDGNPDVPVRLDDRRTMGYRGPAAVAVMDYPARAGNWSTPRDLAFREHGPRWMSSACHRSLYGHHARAALQIALENLHRAVTFASFACWGSDIVNGLFLPMKATEIVPDLPRLSQLSAVAELQCGTGRLARKEWPRAFEMGGALPELIELSGLYCPAEHARRIDMLLVAVGGNDVGFAQLVANTVLSDATPLRQVSGWLGHRILPDQARTALAALPERYKALNRAVHSILHVPWAESDRIVLTAYPPIALDDETGDACASGREGMTVNPAFALDQQRARDSERIGREPYTVMQRAARRHGWTFVDAHRQLFLRHGYCAGRTDSLAAPADETRLPRFADDTWTPFPPSQWEPYAPRRRWIRTPNDAFLTVNYHVPRFGEAIMNLVLASSYSGAFHPTAEGHAAMADALTAKLRGLLRKYALE